jgi:hypothetical protein
MSPYGEIWEFTRGRLKQAYEDLSDGQLRWRPFPGGHNIGEMLYHCAGVEVWFSVRMLPIGRTPELDRLAECARATYITEDPFPFSDGDVTLAAVDQALDLSAKLVRPLVEAPTPEHLTMPVETVIGPVVEGVGCLWRIAQHAAYHTGQMWTYRQDPRFPGS